MSEIPSVLILTPITPTVESARADQLEYQKLLPAVQKYAVDERGRQAKFWDSEQDSLEEEDAARQLAAQYLLMTSVKLTQDAALPASKQLWSDRYTRATSELWGIPETSLAKELIGAQAAQLLDSSRAKGVDHELVNHMSELLDRFGINIEVSETAKPEFAEVAGQIGNALKNKYAHAFQALDLDNAPKRINPESIADRLQKAKLILARDYDNDWNEWTIVRDNDKDQLSIIPQDKQIIVGMNRADASPQELEGLFSHEILVHVIRSLNGYKKSYELATGLPGYLDNEEGLGVFFQYATTGEVPPLNIDRYVDIALALGQIDGIPKSRHELIDFVMTRALIRNEQASSHLRKSDADIQKAVFAHVNRIYRGTLGNEYIGVFTKDILYHKGFIDMGRYITAELKAGKSPELLIEFLQQGKFDPTKSKHLEYLQES